MLSLSDEAMTALMILAHPLQPHQRSAFLEALAVRLKDEVEIGDGVVIRIARELQKAHLTIPNFRSHGATSRRR
jgi:hypothetical protein